jgi:flagellar hook-associated protein FlgK
MAMSTLQAEVYEAFRVLDVPDDKALRAAVAKVEDETASGFNKRDADVEAIRKDIAGINKEVAGINTRMATMQGDINGRITSLQGEVNGRIASLQGEVNLLKWMMGTVIALLVTVLFRVFTH